MADASEQALDDAVRLVSAVLARGADSALVQEIAEEAVAGSDPADLVIDVADIAASSLDTLAEAEGEDTATLLRMIAERRDPPADY